MLIANMCPYLNKRRNIFFMLSVNISLYEILEPDQKV